MGMWGGVEEEAREREVCSSGRRAGGQARSKGSSMWLSCSRLDAFERTKPLSF